MVKRRGSSSGGKPPSIIPPKLRLLPGGKKPAPAKTLEKIVHPKEVEASRKRELEKKLENAQNTLITNFLQGYGNVKELRDAGISEPFIQALVKRRGQSGK